MSGKDDERTNQIKGNILKLLKERGKMHTKEIARKTNMSAATASKYLGILEEGKKVIRDDDKPPYVYWSLKGDNGGQTS